MNDQRLDILMGKLLDGQITPGEQRLLDTRLQTDKSARRRLEELSRTHKMLQEALAGEWARGPAAEQVIDRAWTQTGALRTGRMSRWFGPLPFAAGLAAGLVVGLAAHFLLTWTAPGRAIPGPDTTPTLAQNDPAAVPMARMQAENLSAEPIAPVMRDVDWYHFTDAQGGQWVLEGYRYRENPQWRLCGL